MRYAQHDSSALPDPLPGPKVVTNAGWIGRPFDPAVVLAAADDDDDEEEEEEEEKEGGGGAVVDPAVAAVAVLAAAAATEEDGAIVDSDIVACSSCVWGFARAISQIFRLSLTSTSKKEGKGGRGGSNEPPLGPIGTHRSGVQTWLCAAHKQRSQNTSNHLRVIIGIGHRSVIELRHGCFPNDAAPDEDDGGIDGCDRGGTVGSSDCRRHEEQNCTDAAGVAGTNATDQATGGQCQV